MVSRIIMIKQLYLTIDGALTGTTIPSQSRSGSNGNEGILYIPESCMTGASPSDAV